MLLIGAGSVYFLLRAGMPTYTGEASLEGLKEEVTIERDERAVAHLQGESMEDLAYAQGYIHAQERLWQMETHRRAGPGRVSEIVGEDAIEMDLEMRKVNMPGIIENLAEETSPEGMAVLQSYADGVNTFLEEDILPPEMRLLGVEPEPWTVEDSLSIIGLLGYQMGNNWMEEAARYSLQEELPEEKFADLMPPYKDWDTPKIWTEEQATAFKESKEIEEKKPNQIADNKSQTSEAKGLSESMLTQHGPAMEQKKKFLPRLGSNSWVVSPEMSASGEAVMANDPHLQADLPSIWYENRLEKTDDLNIYGWSIPGAPGVVIGFNQHLSWGLTNIGDSQDLFLEEQHPDNPHKFRYDDEWYEAEIITEEIEVKGKEKPVEHEIIVTRNGPLINEDPPMSLKWTAYDVEGSSADAIFNMNTSRNWAEFKEALEDFSIPIQCIVYADVEGNIGFRLAGHVPVRKKGMGLKPSPGWDPDYGWEGYIPHEEMPELFNPPAQYIANANHMVAGDDYPYTIAYDTAPPSRMQRIVDVLEEGEEFTAADFKELQNDWYNQHAADRLPLFIEALQENQDELNEQELKGMELLEDWAREPVNLPEEPAPAIFQSWYLNFMEEVFKNTMGEDLFQIFLERAYLAYNALENMLEQEDSAWFEPGLNELLLVSYTRTIEELSSKMGSSPAGWQWQELQSIQFPHQMKDAPLLGSFLSRGPYPYGGDHMTVGRAAYDLTNPFQVNHTAGMRYVAVMHPEEVEAYGVIAGGQSGHPLSKHYDDQIQAWLDGEFFPLYSTSEQLGEQDTEVKTLTP